MKKLVTILLALAMIFAMSATAFAADETTVTLTINGAAGHTYKIYQIFTGDVDKEIDGDKVTKVLSNVRYGDNYYPDGKKGELVPETALNNLLHSDDIVDYLETAIKDSNLVVSPEEGKNFIVVENLKPGYYLVKDISDNLTGGEIKSSDILQVLDDVTITSKHATIISTKKVDDKNDSTGAEDDTVWQDAADYDFGDAVPFQLTVTLPSTLENYGTYEVTFHDKQAAGFNMPLPDTFDVYIQRGTGENAARLFTIESGATGYTFTNSCTNRDKCEFKDEGCCTFNVRVGDIIALYAENNIDFANGDAIVVEYKSVLNTSANVGDLGNENSMYVCHPDGHTPKDIVTVLTYELTVNKIDGSDLTKPALAGAGFTLYKKNAAGTYDKVGVIDAEGNTIYELTGDNMTSFTWSGIDGGQYKLEETTTPDGYNTMAPKEFIINAEHAVEWLGGNSALWNLVARNLDNTDNEFIDAKNGVEDGKLEGNIENYKGVILPETGAEGTFFLISIGAMLVIVAAVFMITRKKMSVYEN